MYSNHNIQELLKNRSNEKLIFIHTPKCGGTYVASILSHLNIINKKHVKAIPNEGITFTLVYWTENVDIIITLENLPKMLGYFGYTYDANLFERLNVSKKIRGTLNDENINRLNILFEDDVILYNKVINSTL